MNRPRRFLKWVVLLLTLLILASCSTDNVVQKEKAQNMRNLGEGYLGEGNVTAALTEFLKAEKLYDKDQLSNWNTDGSDCFNIKDSVHIKLMVLGQQRLSNYFHGPVY